ncbi:MAG: sulfite exporter TauE/SafE family protein [Thermodesulfobacteriota bacterium]
MPFTAILHIILFLCFGFIFGILTGFFGVGGGFLVTPALNILGFPMVHAIGTSFAVIVANTLVGAVKHYRLGNVDFRVGVLLGLVSMIGVELGKRQVFYLEGLNLAGPFVRGAYIFSLLVISMLMLLREYYRYVRPRKGRWKIEIKGTEQKKSALALRVSRIRMPPRISLSSLEAGSISIWILLATGASVGFLSGFMGIGGGVVVVPLMIYVMGIPTMIAVGTSLVSTFLTSSYGMAVYAIAGKVEWSAVLIILVASVLGVQVGVHATMDIPPMKIRIFFALFLLFVAISTLLKQIQMAIASICVVSGSALILSLTILFRRIRKRSAIL